MKKLFVLFFLYCFQLPVAYCQLSYWQQKADYTIDVTLNDAAKTLDGRVAIEYYNHSPDTLHFVWINLSANAYKNDRTGYSDQLIENGHTDFYFSDDDKRGYINHLNFTVNGTIAATDNHPQYQDFIKLILPQPIAPNDSAKIETPFHVKLPYDFTGNGHVNRSFAITQWYPKIAVYDSKGWHINTYLNEGGNYNEFGDYEVTITLPKNYVVAATGELQTEEEIESLKKYYYNRYSFTPKGWEYNPKNLKAIIAKDLQPPPSAKESKTITFKQNNTQDFVWFADKRFNITQDTLQLKSGKIINLYIYLLPSVNSNWERSMSLVKSIILARSQWMGEYPYNIVNIVETPPSFANNTNYPTLTSIPQNADELTLIKSIENGIGETWSYGTIASNGYDHLWMDNGINSYYESRYNKADPTENGCHNKHMPNFDSLLLLTIIQQKKDQPIETASDKFSQANYHLIADTKANEWMNKLEHDLGKPLFDSCMQEYYHRWQFKHPYPEDLQKTVEDVSGKKLDSSFALLNSRGNIDNTKTKKQFHLFAIPVVGYNNYDKLMIGTSITNCTLPQPKFQFILTPLYATNSNQLNGIGQLKYTWYLDKIFQKIELGINGERFALKESLDTNSHKIFENFYKVVPSIRFYFRHPLRSTTVSWLDFRTYLITEKLFDKFEVVTDSTGDIFYPVSSSTSTRYINQLTFNVDNYRVLYPYNYQVQLQQGAGFYRLNLTGNYFFNYAKGGGLSVRAFAAKFGYIGGQNTDSYQYQPKLAAGNGTDDYTYGDYFIGRTASYSNPDKPISNQGIAAQQLLIDNTGGLKFRSDLDQTLQGQSDNWVAALNFNTTLPNFLIPFKNPFRLFFDVGSYAEAWGANPQTNRLLYTGGIQLSLFKNILNIYAPIIYSSDFNSDFKSDAQQNTFFKRISFSIDVQNIKLRKFIPAPYQTLAD
ncbi:MAG TPA: hypothetical protein VK559_09680 [Ferruginibacter sp.]|nr:hypothetical protein [Ferruginibacter sp.]